MKKKLLITGGTGFFGKSILRHLSENQDFLQKTPEITILTRNQKKFTVENPEFSDKSWLKIIEGDICKKASLPYQTHFTHILHAAADSTLGPKLDPLQRYDQIVNGTRNLLDLAVATGVKRFLLTSSGGVYGPQPADMIHIPEDYSGIPDPLNANSAYSLGKRAAEHLCALYHNKHGLETVMARCFAFVGQDLPLDIHFAIGNFIRDALYRDEITVQGDGTALRSYLDQRDLAEWLLTMLNTGTANRAYNVGSDRAISIGKLAFLVRDIVSPEKPVSILGNPDPSAVRNRYIPDISRARNELGLNVSIPLDQAIRDAVQAVKT